MTLPVWWIVPAVQSQSVPPKPKELIIAGVSGVETAGLKFVLPLWEEKTGIKTTLLEYPYDSLYEKLVATFQANVSTYDVAMIDDPWMPRFGASGWFVPLDVEFNHRKDPDIFPVVYDLGSWPPPYGPVPPGEEKKETHLYGISVLGNIEIFMYRKDLVSEPRSWDDVLKYAKEVYDIDKPLYGFVMRGRKGDPVVTQFYPILRSYGGRIFDDDWKVVLNKENSVAALKMLLNLKDYAPPGAAAYDAAERSREVAAGRGAMATIWPAEITDIIENRDVSKVVGKMGYTLIPAGPEGKRGPLMGNWLLAIPITSTNKYWAYEFIKWATSKTIQRYYTVGGGIPVRRSILTDPAVNKQFPFFKALVDSLEEPAYWIPRTEEWFTVCTIFGTYLSLAIADDITPKDAIARAAKEIGQYMKEVGY